MAKLRECSLKHGFGVLVCRDGEDQSARQGSPFRFLQQQADRIDGVRIVGGIKNHGRLPVEDFKPQWPAGLLEPGGNGGRSNLLPAGLLQQFAGHNGEAGVVSLVSSEQR